MIKVNGKLVKHHAGMTVAELFEKKRLDPEGYTVLVNSSIVPWDELAQHELRTGDDVRIIFLLSGG